MTLCCLFFVVTVYSTWLLYMVGNAFRGACSVIMSGDASQKIPYWKLGWVCAVHMVAATCADSHYDLRTILLIYGTPVRSSAVTACIDDCMVYVNVYVCSAILDGIQKLQVGQVGLREGQEE